MDFVSREAVSQVVHGIARGIADRDIEAFKAKDMKAFYKAKGAKEILDTVDTDLCYIPAADVQPVDRWIRVDEKLPKPFEEVLCYCISISGDIDAYMIGCINKHWGLLKGETFVSEKEAHRIVAYWQPLPPRPTIDYCRFCKECGANMRGGSEND